jgi:hypothetical protein
MNWALVVCEWRSATDDPASPEVLGCQKRLISQDHIPPSPQANCQLNAKYKSELCRSLVKYGHYKSIQACVKSAESIPHEVSHGIGD